MPEFEVNVITGESKELTITVSFTPSEDSQQKDVQTLFIIAVKRYSLPAGIGLYSSFIVPSNLILSAANEDFFVYFTPLLSVQEHELSIVSAEEL